MIPESCQKFDASAANYSEPAWHMGNNLKRSEHTESILVVDNNKVYIYCLFVIFVMLSQFIFTKAILEYICVRKYCNLHVLDIYLFVIYISGFRPRTHTHTHMHTHTCTYAHRQQSFHTLTRAHTNINHTHTHTHAYKLLQNYCIKTPRLMFVFVLFFVLSAYL